MYAILNHFEMHSEILQQTVNNRGPVNSGTPVCVYFVLLVRITHNKCFL